MMLSPKPRRVLLLGATGTIGRATARVLVQRGHEVVCLLRRRAGATNTPTASAEAPWLEGAILRFGDVTDAASLAGDAFGGGLFDAVVSCLASRSGVPRDAWAVDYAAHAKVLAAAKSAGVPQMVLLSAICVQKPRLAFQHAKLAFERELIQSGLTYSIVRPTAFFKSLSGQIERVRRGKPFLVFGDGRSTACKPISDADCAAYLADCLDDPRLQNRILPIGGPGPAITPRQQGEHLFGLLGRAPRFKSVPLAFLDALIGGLAVIGHLRPAMADKAELARIGRYYASESMLVWDPTTGRYDADTTPSTGSETLFSHYAQVVARKTEVERGDHSVF